MSYADDDPQEGIFEQDNDPAPRKKVNSSARAIVVILITGGVMALVCCGGGVFFAYKLKEGVAVTEDAREVEKHTEEIAQIDVPDRLTPKASMKLRFWIQMGMVVYLDGANGEHGALMLMELPVPIDQAEKSAREQMKQLAKEKKARGEAEEEVRDLDITDSESREREIRGVKVMVHYETGKDRKTGKTFRQVAVAFPGKDEKSSVTLILQTPEEDWNDAEVERMLDSIR